MEKAADVAAGGRVMNGIQCKDVLELLQVSIETQIARLIADTVCRSDASDPAVCREFASNLFGHTFPVIIPRLAVLPEAILWMISKSLPNCDAVALGQTNKQVRDDLSKPVHGFKVTDYVDIKTMLDPSRGWARRKGVIGRFTAFYVSTLDELAHLPRGTLQLELRLPKESILTSANTFPASLTHLTFGDDFNGPVDDLELPASLTHLTFGVIFNQRIRRIELLASLTYLKVGGDKSIENLKLPASLTHLVLGHGGHGPVATIEDLNLPDSLTHLEFSLRQSIETLKLPASLTHLTFGTYFNQPVENLELPASLTHLVIGERVSGSTVGSLKLPASLTHLEVGGFQPIEHLNLPASLTHLTFGTYYNQPIDQITLPASLTHLQFGFYFNQPIDQIKLPASLTHLIFGVNFKRPIDRLKLPASLAHLEFSYAFNQPIDHLKFPASLTYLELDHSYMQSIEKLKLLPRLHIGYSCPKIK